MSFSQDGSVATARTFLDGEAGFLLKASDKALRIQIDPDRNWGIWEGLEEMGYAFPGSSLTRHAVSRSRVLQIPVGRRTRFFYNLDPVPAARIKASRGVFVFVFLDRLGQAKYVDAVRVHLALYEGEEGVQVVALPGKKSWHLRAGTGKAIPAVPRRESLFACWPDTHKAGFSIRFRIPQCRDRRENRLDHAHLFHGGPGVTRFINSPKNSSAGRASPRSA